MLVWTEDKGVGSGWKDMLIGLGKDGSELWEGEMAAVGTNRDNLGSQFLC